MIELDLSKSIKARHGASRLLAEELRREIKSNDYRGGERLPTIQEIMKITSLGYRTVSNAIGVLAKDGLVEARRGTGIFLCSPNGNGMTDSSPMANGTQLNAFALIVPAVRTGLYPSLIHSFGLAAEKLGRYLITCNSEDNTHKQADIILQLIDQQVKGVALAPSTGIHATPAHHVRQLQANGIPVVLLHRGVKSVSAPVIAMSFEEVARRVGRELTNRGHRNIAFFIKNNIGFASPVYERGLRTALGVVGGSLPENLIYSGCWINEELPPKVHKRGIRIALERMMALPQESRPTAIFSSYDTDAEIIYFALKQMGLMIPEDISLVSFGCTWRPNEALQRISSIVTDEEQVGRQAARLLLEMCEGRRELDRQYTIEIPLSLYDGGSLGKVLKISDRSI